MATFVDKVNSGLVKAGLKPVTRDNVLFYYTPLKGCAAYGILSVQMFNPELFENFSFLLLCFEICNNLLQYALRNSVMKKKPALNFVFSRFAPLNIAKLKSI
ncbi:hypothetical protein Hamer_G027683, partial [Homarus americanus]